MTINVTALITETMSINRVLRIVSSTKGYGGDLYEDDVEKAIKAHYQVQSFLPVPPIHNKILALPKYFHNLKNIGKSQKSVDLIIRSMNHAFFVNKPPKQLVIAYHYDTHFSSPLVRAHHYLSLKSLVGNMKQIDKLVVISKFWADYFIKLGFSPKQIELIYCGFVMEDYQVSDEEVFNFKNKYKIGEQKIIYLGNALRKKGAYEAYLAIKDSPFQLYTSGSNSDLHLPVRNLNLNFREYLCLLKIASVVITNSKFKEGWNRVAHEAMLMGTPVIGSGQGGMRELLQGGKQVVCENEVEIKESIKHLIANPEIGQLGKDYAKTFTIEKFNQSWLELIQSLG